MVVAWRRSGDGKIFFLTNNKLLPNAHSFPAERYQGLLVRRSARARIGWTIARSLTRGICRAGWQKRMREIDAAECCGCDGLSDFRPGAARRRATYLPERRGTDAASTREGRLHFSVISTPEHTHGFRERGAAVAPRGKARCACDRSRTVGMGRAGRSRRPL